MGTAGITHFHQGDIDTPVLCHVYKQSDGYPESLGDQIKAILGSKNIVNGIRFDLENQANGMGCAAAQFIAEIKDGTGGIYMIASAPDWADYDYHIYHEGKMPQASYPPARLMMKIMSGNDVRWQGKIEDFDSASLYENDEA